MSPLLKSVYSILFLNLFTITNFTLAQDANERFNWTDNEYWEETNLDFDTLINGTINNKNCKSNVKIFIACFSTVNKMNQLLDKTSYLIIKDNKLEKIKITIEEFLVKNNSYINLLKNTLDPLLLKTINLDFEQQVVDFKALYINEENDSYTAALLYNDYQTIAIDPHSYISPYNKVLDRSQSQTKNRGFGFRYSIEEAVNNTSQILILDVIDESAADKAGIKKNDLILKVNGKTNLNEMISELIKDGETEFIIERDDELLNIKVEKDFFVLKNVNYKVIQRSEGAYGYISITNFMSIDTCKDVGEAINTIKKEKYLKGVILDLRDNGGGRLDQATCIMTYFLEPGSLSIIDKAINENIMVYKKTPLKKPRNFLQDIYTTVLINGASASASEALAMYLQDYQKSIIVGERSFGKGSMQGLGPHKSGLYGPDAEKIAKGQTAALYYGPKGLSPQIVGITPDIKAFPAIDQTESTPYLREADLFTYPIEDRYVDKSKLVDPNRIDQLNKVKVCVKEDSSRVKLYNSISSISEKKLFDNQLETAIVTINCARDTIIVYGKIILKQTKDIPLISYNEYRLQAFQNVFDQIPTTPGFKPRLPNLMPELNPVDVDIPLTIPGLEINPLREMESFIKDPFCKKGECKSKSEK